MDRIKKSILTFFEKPNNATSLGVFRISIALFSILQILFILQDSTDLLGQYGWVQWELSHALPNIWMPHIEDLYTLVQGFNSSEDQVLSGFLYLYLFVLVGVAVGWKTKIWASIAWLMNLILVSSFQAFIYGIDIFMQISLFYIMVMPTHKAFSIDCFLNPNLSPPNRYNQMAIRTLQIHLCLVYLSAGIEKMLTTGWWNGEVIWFALMQPEFNQVNFSWLANYPWIAMIIGWSVLLLEVGYAIFMWIPKWRTFWLSCVILMHIGISIFMGMPMFGVIMTILSLTTWGKDCLKDMKRPTHKLDTFESATIIQLNT